MGGRLPISDETARAVDQEVRALLDEVYGETRALVRAHREALLGAVHELLEHEVMDGARFRDLILPKAAPEASATPDAPPR